jgi:flagellar basal-body rod modification protein FlgD
MSTVNTTNTALALASSAPKTTSKADASSKQIAGNFDQFLQLLTAQLKNQSPLDPLDTNQFTQQLVQFAGVEQQINTNKLLEGLVGNAAGGQSAGGRAQMVSNAMGFVGATVTADGTKGYLINNQAKWKITAPRAGEATVTITDKTGATVHTRNIALTDGQQDFVWDGRGLSGAASPAGEYTIAISATNALNQSMAVNTEVEGVVDSVDVTGNAPVLRIGGIAIDISNVRTIRRN